MILNRLKLIYICVVTSLTIQSQNNNSDGKENFYSAKQQIEDMLSGKVPLSFEKAVFITENAFHNNKYQFDDFKFEIDVYSEYIKWHSQQANKKNVNDFKSTLIETAEVKYNKHLKNLINYSIYTFLTDTVRLIDGDSIYSHSPYSYSLSDPIATKNWNNSQVINLLFNTKTGNCYALTSLFKIFSERLNSDAFVTTAPNHIFISHKDEKDITYNVEVGSKAFPGNGSIEALTYTTDRAIKSHIAMRALNMKQNIALNLIYLAKSYQNKYNITNDDFLLDCANSALKFDSLSLNAMLLKAEVLEEKLFASLKDNNITAFDKVKNNSFAFDALKKYEAQIKTLFNLGYLEMPTEMKNIILSGFNNDPYIPVKNNTPTALQSKGEKHDKDYITLSKGVFEENPMPKVKERYSRIIFDTKKNCIIGFTEKEKTYNNYNFDPVLFALSIDPLAAKYPYYSPYSAFGNNPILYVDGDGRENIVYLVYIPDTRPKAQKVDAKQIAAEANANYAKMGLSTRVVVVDQSVTGKMKFDAAKIDKTDAVAVIGNVADVKSYIKTNDKTKSGYDNALDSWTGGSSNPELSENFVGGQGDDNKRGGDFIAIDVNGLGSTNAQLKTDNNKSAAILLMHGSGHNAEDPKKGLEHQPKGVMVEDIGTWSTKEGVQGVIKTGDNKSFIDHIKQRFGSNQAKVNYNGKGTVVK